MRDDNQDLKFHIISLYDNITMEQTLGFKEMQSFSSGGTFKSQFEYNLEQESQETFFDNLKKALAIMGNLHNIPNTENAMIIASSMNSTKILTRNIWVLALALLVMVKYGDKALENVKMLTKLEPIGKIDVIRYIQFINDRA